MYIFLVVLNDVDTKMESKFTYEMELARGIEYQRRNKQLGRICREYKLNEGNISERFLSHDILLHPQYQVGKNTY